MINRKYQKHDCYYVSENMTTMYIAHKHDK